MRKIKLIIVHHTATDPTVTRAQIERSHQARGFRGIGYHWLIHETRGASGSEWVICAGRLESEVGAHDAGQNPESIGIALAGDYTSMTVPKAAWDTLVRLVADRCVVFGLDATCIQGHREFEPPSTPTICPGFDLEPLRRDVAAQLAAVAVDAGRAS